MIKIDELNIEVEDVDDFNGEAEEILDALCASLEKEHLKVIPKEDLDPDNVIAGYWDRYACKLIEEEMSKLSAIGCKYFNEFDVDISTEMYKEE